MKKVIKSPIFWGILAALIVVVPQIDHYRFLSTDTVHAGVLEGVVDYPGLGPFTLYQFSDGTPRHNAELASGGHWPWLIHPNWKLSFCRHLPSALIALNHKICGLNPAGYAIHSLLWYIALIIMLGLLVCRLVPGPEGKGAHPAAYLTVIIFAFAFSNSYALFYGAARWIIMTAFFGLAGLLAHIKWREQDWKPGRILSPAAFFLALLCGEAALAVMAFLVAYELFGRKEAVKKKAAALLPAAILAAVYLVVYRLIGYGAENMGLYTNPLNDPLAYLAALPVKIAAILGEMFFGTIYFWGLNPILPSRQLPILLAGAAVLVVMGFLFFPMRSAASPARRRMFDWILAGTFASMLPLSSATIGGRVIIIPFIGGSIVLAFILHYWGQRLRRNLKSPVAWIGGLFCLGLFFFNLLLSPYAWFSGVRELSTYVDMWEKTQKETVLNDILPHQEAVFLNDSPDISWLHEAHYYRKIKRLPMPRSWWQLSFSSGKHRYTRTAGDTLEMQIVEGSLPETYDYLGLTTPGNVLKKGNVIHLTGLRATILDIDKKGLPRVEFKFDQPLEDERYRFYKFHETKLQLVTPPAIGETIEF